MEKPKFATLQKVRTEERTYAITPRIPGGFVTPEILEKISNVARKYHATVKITSGQRIMLLGIDESRVNDAWADLDMEPAVLSPYSVKNVEMCPASFCKRAKQNSMKLGMKLEKRFYGAPAPNRTKIGVAGCRNACTSVNSKDIGVLADETGYIIVAGGSSGYYPRLPDTIATGLTESQAYHMVEAVFEQYVETADMGEKLGPFIDKVGLEVFREGAMKRYAIKLEMEESTHE
jgi:NAD(P)H-nitrite reductase large subunit